MTETTKEQLEKELERRDLSAAILKTADDRYSKKWVERGAFWLATVAAGAIIVKLIQVAIDHIKIQ